jgi:hypothetical protein
MNHIKCILLLFGLTLLGCRDSCQKGQPSEHKTAVPLPLKNVDKGNDIILEMEIPIKRGAVQFAFDDFLLEIEELEVFSNQGPQNKIYAIQDTIKVYVDIETRLNWQKMSIYPKREGSFKLYQAHQNTLAVSKEGEYCDLIDWKNFQSKWKELKKKDEKFTLYKYSLDDHRKFLDLDMKEIRQALRVHCGDNWADYIKDAKSPNESPCWVSISNIYLKVVYFSASGQPPKESIIVIEVPMGV